MKTTKKLDIYTKYFALTFLKWVVPHAFAYIILLSIIFYIVNMLSLLKNKTFLLFFIGNITSLIGFGFNLIAISWMVLEESGSEYLLGKIMMASATAPGLILAIFAGVIIDKVNRKWLLVSLDIFRLIVVSVFLYFISKFNFEVSFVSSSLFYGVGEFVVLANSSSICARACIRKGLL